MKSNGIGRWLGLATAFAAAAPVAAQQGNGTDAVIGPPQLQNFQLPAQQPTPVNPDVQGPPAETPPQRAPATTATPQQQPPARQPAPAPRQPARVQPTRPQSGAATPVLRPTRPQLTPSAPQPSATRPAAAQPTGNAPSEALAAPPEALPASPETAPVSTAPAPSPAPEAAPPLEPAAPETQPKGGVPTWLYGVPVALLVVLFGFYALRRRRLAPAGAGPAAEPPARPASPPPSAPAAPRVDPMDRPWLELALKADRATFGQDQAVVLFELEIGNTGKLPARNVRIDVKLFNAGVEQDKEIGAFFRTAGRETSRLTLPSVEAGIVGVIRGEVGISRDEMRAVRLNERLLFIPVVAVNALYDWGDGLVGQTSKSYVIGRELQEQTDKMGAFRVDLGPRTWRSVGQRQHKLARRV